MIQATLNATCKKAPWWRTGLRWLFHSLLWSMIASIVLVLILRWLPIPFSGVMVERAIADWLDDRRDIATHYQWTSMDRIAPFMQMAVIAGEDQRFAEHNGFDWEQMEKAWRAHQRGKKLRGASTISQQVAKNLFLWSGRSYLRKGLEAWFTIWVELLWSKQRILEVHLNIVEFGTGIYGVEAAARQYFGKPAARLTVSQAALLAAVLPNPHRFKVKQPSAYVLKRQQWIQQQIFGLGANEYLKAL